MEGRRNRGMFPYLPGIFVLLGFLTTAVAAEKPVTVVELFTSQGCSSCPPADILFRELAERDDMVALAYHIDYWDYLGWKDSLASSENTNRQKAYAEVFGGSVYTPQLVINGSRHVVGSEREKVEAAVSAPSTPDAPSVDISSNENSIFIHIGESRHLPDGAHVALVFFQPKRLVEIKQGQNAGREIDYRNIVTRYQTVGIWHGEAMSIEIPKSEMKKNGDQCAVLVQQVDEDGRPGAILGAAQSREL